MMKKTLFSVLFAVMLLIYQIGYAAGYTPLPEKLEKQITYGSGVSGSFTVSSEGEISGTPFFRAVSDAEYAVRGLVSGTDLLFSVFQVDQHEQQTGCTEIYRNENQYYLRSDMVQGKVLQFPDRSTIIDSFLLQKGENPSPASFIAEMTNLSETTGKNTLDSLFSRYRYELELWLSGYVTDGVFVRLDDGQSAFDSSYDIPVSEIKTLILKLMNELTADSEVSAFLDTVMTPEQKAVYMNRNLMYFYEEALNGLDLTGNVRINRRATTLGAVISTDLIMPLDPKTVGYQTLSIHSQNEGTTYSLSGDNKIVVLSVPDKSQAEQPTAESSYLFARIDSDQPAEKNIAVRISILKDTETHEDDEGRYHQTDHYNISVQQDESCVPESFDRSLLAPFEKIEADISLHYSSKFAQNSSTKLEFTANVKQGSASAVNIQGSVKTVNSDTWVFKPFDIAHAAPVGTDFENTIISYGTDWISNASSMIHHTATEETSSVDDSSTDVSRESEENSGNNEQDDSGEAETAPLGEE